MTISTIIMTMAMQIKQEESTIATESPQHDTNRNAGITHNDLNGNLVADYDHLYSGGLFTSPSGLNFDFFVARTNISANVEIITSAMC